MATKTGSNSSLAALVCGAPGDVARALKGADTWPRVRPVGVVSRGATHAARVGGLPVVGETLSAAIAASAAPIAVIVLCGGGAQDARALLQEASALNLSLMVASGNGQKLRKMRVADLLGGLAPRADLARVRAKLAGKRVLVTGAGGSIGSELCRKLARMGLARLTLLENSEFNLYRIDHELAVRAPSVSRGRALCDVRDADAVSRWFRREQPDVVLHVAALKHVPMVEEFASEGVLTNVVGTRNIAEAARAVGAHMMLVSTDKAASPASAMGASKRIAELICQSLDRQGGGTRFLTARLGNVLGSAGSVSPMFARQIAAGGPVTVTHPDVARFFITIPQAARFLLQALAVGLEPDAPRGVALVLDMGEPVRVVDLARDMIRLHGLKPDADVPISFVGLRPGEKLTEQLIDEHETMVSAPGEAIMAVQSAARDYGALAADIDRLALMARAGQDELVKQRLRGLVGASPRLSIVS